MLPDKITTREHCNTYADELAKLENRIAGLSVQYGEDLIKLKESYTKLEELKKDRKKIKAKLGRFAISKKGQIIFGSSKFLATTPLAEYGVNIGKPLETIEGWDEQSQIKALRDRGHDDAIIIVETVNKEIVEKFDDEEKEACGFVTGLSRSFYHKLRTDNDKPDKTRTVTIPEPAAV